MNSEDIKALPDEQPPVDPGNDQQETQEPSAYIAPAVAPEKSNPAQTANGVVEVLDSEDEGKFLFQEILDCLNF